MFHYWPVNLRVARKFRVYPQKNLDVRAARKSPTSHLPVYRRYLFRIHGWIETVTEAAAQRADGLELCCLLLSTTPTENVSWLIPVINTLPQEIQHGAKSVYVFICTRKNFCP